MLYVMVKLFKLTGALMKKWVMNFALGVSAQRASIYKIHGQQY